MKGKLMRLECFLSRPSKTQSPQIREIIEVKTRSKPLGAFGQNCADTYSNKIAFGLCFFSLVQSAFYSLFLSFFFLLFFCAHMFLFHQFWLVLFFIFFNIFLENSFGLISCAFFF